MVRRRNSSNAEISLGNDFEINYLYLKRLIEDLKMEDRDTVRERIFGSTERGRNLTKKEMKELFRFLGKVQNHYEECQAPPIPLDLEKSICDRDPGEWLPWEAEAIQKLDEWREKVKLMRFEAKKMFAMALERIRSGREPTLGTEYEPGILDEGLRSETKLPEEALPSPDEVPSEELYASPSQGTQAGYDVALSFVQEDADFAHRIAHCLQQKGLRVFHGTRDVDDLWGINLAEHFGGVYWSARLCLIIMSQFYRVQGWGEFESALLARRARINPDYRVMLVTTDEVPTPDSFASHPIINLRSISVAELCTQVKATLDSLPDPRPTESLDRDRKVVRVISSEGAWAVKPEEAQRALRIFNTRQRAVEFTESLRERDPSLEVVVHNSDGTVHERVSSHI